MPHVSLGSIEQPLKLQPVGVSVRDDVAHLTHYGGKDKHPYQVAYYGEDIPAREYL